MKSKDKTGDTQVRRQTTESRIIAYLHAKKYWKSEIDCCTLTRKDRRVGLIGRLKIKD